MSFLRQWFGDFTREELKKYVLLGVIFALIIGIYWALRPLKDALFQDMVGGTWQPRAKWLSLVVMAVLVPTYSWLVNKLQRQTLFYLLSAIYGTLAIIFAGFMYSKAYGLDLPADPARILGWTWYVFVESFGSLIVALFWAFAADISTDESAKRGFSLVVMIGQIGGIVGPAVITPLPKWFSISNAIPVLVCGFLIYLIIPFVMYFISTMPKEELQGFHGKNVAEVEKSEEHEPGFFEGLKLLVSQPYLLGIFGVVTFYEIIVTVFDYYFKIMAEAQILDKALKTAYLGQYAVYANLGTFLCLLFGISNITRRLGVTVSLGIVPLVVGAATIFFRGWTTMTSLFWLMVGAKSINYALNGPALKQLYVPTTKDTRYKAQAWIESFGSRGAKAAGSGLNDLHKNVLVWKNGPEWANQAFRKANVFGASDVGSFWYIAMTSYLFFGIIAVWFFVALYLGRTYQKAVDQKRVVC